MKPTPLLLGLLALIVICFAACDVETEFVTGEAVQLRFSTDTVAFDTVFASRGSATQIMKVYNELDQPVMIDRIKVNGETGVSFIFNVDGVRGPVAEDVVIWANDSIFVFVEVEVDPTEPAQTSPFIAEDHLVFETGNAREEVLLLAYGQNANYLNGFNRGQFALISCENGTVTFSQDLPTVIYGSLVIEDCTVQALPGTKIYVHGGVQFNEGFPGSGFFNDGIILTEKTGSLQLLGEPGNPVIVRTDRLEAEFEDAPGKYRGLIFRAGSRNNMLQHTQLLNATTAVTVDSTASVTIDDSVIAYSAGPAVFGYQAEVTVRNSLFHSNFADGVQMIKGGRLIMEHTTIANYGVDASSLRIQNFRCDENGEICFPAPTFLRVRNSILGGSRGQELILLDIFNGEQPGDFNVDIANTVVRTNGDFLASQDSLFADFYERICDGCYNLQSGDPLFQSISEDDYNLDSLSVARNLGAFLPDLPTDLLGVARDMTTPDAGALERVDL